MLMARQTRTENLNPSRTMRRRQTPRRLQAAPATKRSPSTAVAEPLRETCNWPQRSEDGCWKAAVSGPHLTARTQTSNAASPWSAPRQQPPRTSGAASRSHSHYLSPALCVRAHTANGIKERKQGISQTGEKTICVFFSGQKNNMMRSEGYKKKANETRKTMSKKTKFDDDQTPS